MTDGVEAILCVSRSIKHVCNNVVYISSKLHPLYLAAETIKKCHPEVNELIT